MYVTLFASVDSLQSMCAIEVIHSHGTCDDAMRDIFAAVVPAKLLYTSPAWWITYLLTAWWRFATTADKQRIEAFVRRGVLFL